MKKKSNKIKISASKIILLSTIIFAVGIFLLFFNFLISSPSTINDDVVETTQIERQESGKTSETKPSPSVALAPKPEEDVFIIPEPEDDIVIPKTKDGLLVFIFDDGGHQLSHTQDFVDLPFPVTIAVLPQLTDSVKTANLVRNTGNELFLHQPMQAMNLNINPGPGAILPDMTTGAAASVLRQNVVEIGPVLGVNNHEGSLITSDRNIIGAVIDACQDLGIMFLDSRTTAQTAVPMVALERGIEVLERDIFIDNEKDKAYMKEMIEKGLQIADTQGYVIMIGHVTTPLLASLLDEMYEDLSQQGYTFTTPSELRKKI